MWMGPDKRLVNARCRKRMRCLLLIAGLRLSARQATPDGSEEKSFVPVLLCFRHIPISSSARLVEQAMGITEVNCNERSG